MKRNFLTIALFFTFLFLQGQVVLVNGGFEDQPSDATVPKGWLPCERNTTPDILPGFWGEYGDASQGKTYVGLITRDDGSFESIGQKLSKPLNIGECYEFRIDLAKGNVYAGFNQALKLRVWLGETLCEMEQMIFLSEEVKHPNWKSYQVKFTPAKNHKYIRIEAFHKEGIFSYKGNILIDNMSSIKSCSRA
jgi:hypothetical protein